MYHVCQEVVIASFFLSWRDPWHDPGVFLASFFTWVVVEDVVKVLAVWQVLGLSSDVSFSCLQVRMKIKIFNSKKTGP